MADITFITGNQNKADYLAKCLGMPVTHKKADLDEIQSLDLKKIIEHKARQAYELIKSPVIVEDVSLEFEALGRLPGPFIRFFIEEIPFEVICSMLNGMSRKAIARTVLAYFDGAEMKIFERSFNGQIAESPSGKNGFGWDVIFIPEGYNVTRASLGPEDDQKTYLEMKPFDELKEFLLAK